jgi:hypothetical protein
MAASTSPAVQQGASAKTSPVLESVTGIYLSAADSRHSPLMQYFRVSTLATSLYLALSLSMDLTYPVG